jgi:hypothetical protein
MNIQVPHIDGRTRRAEFRQAIVDLDSGKDVGILECRQGSAGHSRRYPSRVISLFDGKYREAFESHAECVAFAKGVEAVINQATAPKDQPPAPTYYDFTRVDG